MQSVTLRSAGEANRSSLMHPFALFTRVLVTFYVAVVVVAIASYLLHSTLRCVYLPITHIHAHLIMHLFKL